MTTTGKPSSEYKKNWDTTFAPSKPRSEYSNWGTTFAPSNWVEAAREDEDEDAAYQELVLKVSRSLLEVPAEAKVLFRVGRGRKNAYYDIFLRNLPSDLHGHYECLKCRRFFSRMAGVVYVDALGRAIPVLRGVAQNPPKFFRTAIEQVVKYAAEQPIVALADPYELQDLGNSRPERSEKHACEFRHLHFTAPAVGRFEMPDTAATRKGVDLLRRARRDVRPTTMSVALNFLENRTDMLRAQELAPRLRWLYETLMSVGQRDANLWLAAAEHPVWCHAMNGVLGKLVEDVARGASDLEVVQNWNKVLSPATYQRPQAAPKEGTIDRAEALFQKLGLDRALARKFATEVPEELYLWRAQRTPATPTGGMFRDLRGSRNRDAALPDLNVGDLPYTWFAQNVLPRAEALDCQVSGSRGNFFGFTDALYPDAPPLFKWKGNLSYYLYAGGSFPGDWNLKGGTWCPVRGVTMGPAGPEGLPSGAGAYFILKGARELHPERVGLGLFPEIMRGDLHEVRSVIERASKTRKMARDSSKQEEELAGVVFHENVLEPNGRRAPEACVRLRATYASGSRVVMTLTHWM